MFIVTKPFLLTEPRYASLPNIMKAKKKPIEKLKPEDLSVDLKPILETIKVTEPPTRKGGQKVRSWLIPLTVSCWCLTKLSKFAMEYHRSQT